MIEFADNKWSKRHFELDSSQTRVRKGELSKKTDLTHSSYSTHVANPTRGSSRKKIPPSSLSRISSVRCIRHISCITQYAISARLDKPYPLLLRSLREIRVWPISPVFPCCVNIECPYVFIISTASPYQNFLFLQFCQLTAVRAIVIINWNINCNSYCQLKYQITPAPYYHKHKHIG